MSNIAEGFERGGDREFFQFVSLAKGSSGEVRAQLYVALDAGYIDQQTFSRLSDMTTQINRMLAGLMKYLRSSELKRKQIQMSDQSTLDFGQGTLDSSRSNGPVTCLGITFENDDARRKHFTEKLREKLQDPEFRKIEGFPTASTRIS